MKSFSNNRLSRLMTHLGVAALWLLIWQGASMAVDLDLLLPSPASVGARLWALSLTGNFWIAVAASMGRIMGGFLLALAAGAALAVLTAHVRAAEVLIRPLIGAMRATPVASFIILALVWLPGGSLGAFIPALMVLPIVWENLAEGIRRTDPKLLEMAKVFRLPRLKKLTAVLLPSVLPYLLSACRNGIGFAWKSGIAAEVLSNPDNAIGSLLYRAKIQYETPDLFALTAVIILLSVLLERLFLRLTARLMPDVWVKEETR